MQVLDAIFLLYDYLQHLYDASHIYRISDWHVSISFKLGLRVLGFNSVVAQ